MTGFDMQEAEADGPLRAVKLAFLAALDAGERPDGWLRRYPQHATTLIDLAQARAAEAVQPPPGAAAVAAVAAIARRTLAQVAPPAAVRLSDAAARAGFSLRELAARAGLSSDILVKIDRCVIRPETVPGVLVRELAALLGCAPAALRAGLLGAGPRTAGAFYHAAQAPQVGQQSFAEAVAASVSLTPAARARWLQVAAAPDDGET